MLPLAVYPNGVALKFNRIATLWWHDSALVGGSPGDERQLLRENIKAPVANGSERLCGRSGAKVRMN